MRQRLLAVFGILALASGRTCAALAGEAPNVETDKADYSPGSQASITGKGFRPGEKVRLQILRIDVADNGGPEHQPWQVKADGKGSFKATWPVTVHEAGATLQLAAKGTTSGRKAQKIFTDSSITPASGGGAIPASTAGGTWTALTGPVIVETIVGDINVGTLILTAPSGFVFDTNAPLPIITLSGDNNNKNINGLSDGTSVALTVTTNTIGFTIATKSHGQTRNTLTYSNIRVRPTAATPLASGNITNTGTAAFPNSTTNFGTLTEVAGPITQLAVSGFPTPRTAGVAGNVTVAARDQFGNVVTGYTGTVHFTSSDPLAVLPSDYSFFAGDSGTHTFTNGATLKTFGVQSITASNLAPASFSGTQAGISVVPSAADHLAFATQPGSATYGSPLGTQPVVVSQDAFGNNSTAGLPASKIVSVTLSSGSGTLTGTSSVDIGTAAGNGTATFANLAINAAGASKQLTASATGLSNALSSAFTINPATLTGSVTVSNKVYDGAVSATVGSRGVSGVLGGDSVTLTGGTATFTSKTAGNGKTVNVTGLGLSGASAGNYALASTAVSTTANIAPATLTLSGVTANSKPYDGTTSATLSGGSLAGVVSGDNVTLGGTPSGTFTSKTVGNNKPVTASGYALSGADSGNYTLAQPIGLTANITAAGLTVSGVTANNKVYDATTTATLNMGAAALVGVVSGDSVTLSTGSASGSFTTKTVGAAKAVTVSGLTISGVDSGNYSLAQPGTSADITAKGLTVSDITANNKIYDGSTSAALTTGSAALVGVLAGDAVTLSSSGAAGSFANRSVGTGKTVTVSGLTLSGADSDNYSLSQPSTTADITTKGLTVSGVTANNKVYDGNTSATLNTGSAALNGAVSGDSVTLDLSGLVSSFGSKTVGTAKAVTLSGLTLTGTDSGNYSLTQPGASADITAKELTVSGVTANNKIYDGNTSATLNNGSAALVGVVSGDSLTLSAGSASGSFATKTVAAGKTVTVSGLTISGTDASNYSLTQPGTTADITAKGLTVSGVTANDKIYDGTTSAALNVGSAGLVGVVSGDSVTLNTGSANGTFANANAALGKSVSVSGFTISGTDAANYSLSQPTATANISQAMLTVSADAKSRVYGAVNPALTASFEGFVNGEDASVLSGAPQLTTVAAPASQVGNYPIVIAFGTLASLNYAFNFANASLVVTPHALSVTADVKSRVYGAANPVFTGILTGVQNGDNITASYSTAATGSSSVGSYGIVPALNDPDGKLFNYSVTLNNGSLSISPAQLVAVANDTSRGFGQPNPSFTASIWGYVNAENVSQLGGALVLTTTAQTNSPPGDYPIVPSGLTSANYTITYSNGTLLVTTTNQAPVLDPIADAVIRPEEGFVVKLHGSDPNGDSVSFSLDPGAPMGASISTIVKTNPVPTTNTVFRWRPNRDQASTTNVITIRVTDDGGPAMSSIQTFTIIVLDYLEIIVGSTNVQSGQSVTVPIALASSDGVTNLSFSLQWPATYLSNATLVATAPEIAVASLQDRGTNLALSFQTAAGQALQGTQQIAQLTFTAISNAYSAFVPLPVDSTSAGKPDGSSYTNYITPVATIAVIEGEPLLKASLTTNSIRELTLYGRLWTSYELQYSTNLSLPNGWGLWMNYVQTNGEMTVQVDSLNPNIFYRIFKP